MATMVSLIRMKGGLGKTTLAMQLALAAGPNQDPPQTALALRMNVTGFATLLKAKDQKRAALTNGW